MEVIRSACADAAWRAGPDSNRLPSAVLAAAHPYVLPARIRRHSGGDIPTQLGIWVFSITFTSPVKMFLMIMEFGIF